MSKQQPFGPIPGGGSASAPQARGGATPLDKMGSRVSQEDADKASERRAERRRMSEAAEISEFNSGDATVMPR